MSRRAIEITLSVSETAQLEKWCGGHRTPRALAERAQIILWAAQGQRNDQIAQRMGGRRARVSKWRRRFASHRVRGLLDAPRPGQPVKYGREYAKRLLARLDNPPPAGYARWNGRLLAEALKLPADWVWAVLRHRGISLERRRSWCVSTDPQFAPKAADIVGLYLDPPETRRGAVGG